MEAPASADPVSDYAMFNKQELKMTARTGETISKLEECAAHIGEPTCKTIVEWFFEQNIKKTTFTKRNSRKDP